MSLDRQIPGQSGVAKQDKIDKANRGKLEAMIRLKIKSKTKPKLRPRKVPRRASAYLNMNTARKDIEWAEICWEQKKDEEAVWSIELAIHQLNAAKAKLARSPSPSTPDPEA